MRINKFCIYCLFLLLSVWLFGYTFDSIIPHDDNSYSLNYAVGARSVAPSPAYGNMRSIADFRVNDFREHPQTEASFADGGGNSLPTGINFEVFGKPQKRTSSVVGGGVMPLQLIAGRAPVIHHRDSLVARTTRVATNDIRLTTYSVPFAAAKVRDGITTEAMERQAAPANRLRPGYNPADPFMTPLRTDIFFLIALLTIYSFKSKLTRVVLGKKS